MMKLRHLERAVEHEPVYHIRHLAKPAAVAPADLAAAYRHPLKEAVLPCGWADGAPKRKGLAGLNDNAVYLLAGKADIGHFILLQGHVNTVQPAQQQRGVTLDDIRQFLSAAAQGYPVIGKQIPCIAQKDLLLERYLVAQRTYLAKQFSRHFQLLLPVFYHILIIFQPLSSIWVITVLRQKQKCTPPRKRDAVEFGSAQRSEHKRAVLGAAFI